MLQRLSEALAVPYWRLMELADYLVPDDDPTRASRSEEPTTMATDAHRHAPTNQELARLLESVLDELAELRRTQQQLTAALERMSPGDA